MSVVIITEEYHCYQLQSSLVTNPSGIHHFNLRPVTFYDHFSLQIA
jgi:hypothetical protein